MTHYTRRQLETFMALAQAHDRTDDLNAAMTRHPAGNAFHTTGVRDLTRHGPIPRDLPPLTDADGTPSSRLPTTTPEDHA